MKPKEKVYAVKSLVDFLPSKQSPGRASINEIVALHCGDAYPSVNDDTAICIAFLCAKHSAPWPVKRANAEPFDSDVLWDVDLITAPMRHMLPQLVDVAIIKHFAQLPSYRRCSKRHPSGWC